MKLYPTITTTAKDHFQKLEEAKRLGLEEVCFFSTAILISERERFYNALEKSSIKSIPFVHIRSDAELWELDLLAQKYHTKAFNCHSQKEFPLTHDLSKYKERIFIENTPEFPYDPADIEGFGGICIDFSHLELIRVYRRNDFSQNLKIISQTRAGCAHISAIGKFLPYFPIWAYFFSDHYLRNLSEVDYLLKYREFFPEIMALELENSLEEQLKIIDYLSSKISTSKT
jgi:hypothetical protein